MLIQYKNVDHDDDIASMHNMHPHFAAKSTDSKHHHDTSACFTSFFSRLFKATPYLLGDDGDDHHLQGGHPRGQHQPLIVPVAHHAHTQSPGAHDNTSRKQQQQRKQRREKTVATVAMTVNSNSTARCTG